MQSVHRIALATSVIAILLLGGCASAPKREALVAKLIQTNGLTNVQAQCVTRGLYEGVPTADPPIKALTVGELRAVAKPDNAGKVSAATLQTLKDVVARCVPAANNTSNQAPAN